jgi:nicotinamide-nucleotide adenylyltransferase
MEPSTLVYVQLDISERLLLAKYVFARRKFDLNYAAVKAPPLETGLFIGRFQPFHLGHLATVKFSLGKVDTLIIAIGSAQLSHHRRNPFSAGERFTMIRAALGHQTDIDLDNVMIIPVSDIDVHPLWASHVRALVPRFDIVFSNDPFTISLFRSEGILVEEPPLLERAMTSATHVRHLIENDGAWKALVPSAVADYVTSIGGVSRLKIIANRDAHEVHPSS